MAAYLPSDSQGLTIATTPDLRILLFTIAVTMATGLLFGLAPALQATKPDVAPTLKDQAGAVVGGGNSLLRKSLVAAQVTLSLLLLIGAGLFVKSLSNLRALGPGFPAERLIGFQIDPTMNGYTRERTKLLYRSLTEALGALPGVQSVGLASMRILEDNEWDNSARTRAILRWSSLSGSEAAVSLTCSASMRRRSATSSDSRRVTESRSCRSRPASCSCWAWTAAAPSAALRRPSSTALAVSMTQATRAPGSTVTC